MTTATISEDMSTLDAVLGSLTANGTCMNITSMGLVNGGVGSVLFNAGNAFASPHEGPEAHAVGVLWVSYKPSFAALSSGKQKAMALLDEWMADESGYDERTWPRVREALECERIGQRQLFGG